MATFPTLTPSTRTYTPGEYPHSPFAGMSGAEGRMRHNNVMVSSQLRLSFAAITEAQMLSILSHYQGQSGAFLSFSLPADVWSGVTSSSDYQLSSYGWRYIEPPTVEDLMCGGHNVQLMLETVTPEGTALAGLAKTVFYSVTGGTAIGANGANLTVTATLQSGEASISVGLNLVIGVSLSPGQPPGTSEETSFWQQWRNWSTLQDDVLLFTQ